MRGQIIFRAAVGSSTTTSEPHKAMARNADPFTYLVGVGMLEAEIDTLQTERLYNFTLSARAGKLTGHLSLSAAKQPEFVTESCFNDLARNLQIEAPAFGALLTCGGIYVRKTRFPSPAGHETHAIFCLLRSPAPKIQERMLYQVQVKKDLAFSFGDPEPCPEAYLVGSVVSDPLSQPIWGFTEPKRAFLSTLSLDMIDACAEIIRLFNLGSPSEEDQAILASLQYSPAWHIVSHRLKDESYAAFLAKAHELGLDTSRHDVYPTAAEIEAREEISKRAIDAIFETLKTARPNANSTTNKLEPRNGVHKPTPDGQVETAA